MRRVLSLTGLNVYAHAAATVYCFKLRGLADAILIAKFYDE